jgi:tetratricopeptide (TPR) repeat protein
VVGDYAGAEKELKSAAELVMIARLQGDRSAEEAGYRISEYLGDIYYLAERYLDAAATYQNAAVESNPSLLGLYRKIGVAYEKAGLYVDAEKSWTEVIRLSQKEFRVTKTDPPQTCRHDEVAAYLSLVKMQIAAEQCEKAASTLHDARVTNPVCVQWTVGELRGYIRCPQ